MSNCKPAMNQLMQFRTFQSVIIILHRVDGCLKVKFWQLKCPQSLYKGWYNIWYNIFASIFPKLPSNVLGAVKLLSSFPIPSSLYCNHSCCHKFLTSQSMHDPKNLIVLLPQLPVNYLNWWSTKMPNIHIPLSAKENLEGVDHWSVR